jgi:hypothetical protein
LAHRENDIILNGVKERVAPSAPAVALTDLLRRSVNAFVELQRKYLDLAARQNEAWLDVAKTGKPFTGKQMAELAREGMEHFVEAQREFLDFVAEEAGKATGSPSDKHGKKTEVAELASNSIDALIEAQKKLLDTANHQLKTNLKAMRGTRGVFSPVAGATVADLTRQSVESFVSAQKALLDVMMRPRPAAPPGHPSEKPRTSRVPSNVN